MPYNLRKRSRPEPEAEQVVVKPVVKRRRKVIKAEEPQEKKPQVEVEPKQDHIEDKVPVTEEPPKVVTPEVITKKKDVKVETKTLVTKGRHQLAFGADSCGELGLGKIGITKKLPANVPIKESIKQVICGPMHTLSLTEDGRLYSYGCNDEGALGRVTDGDEELEATPTIVEIENRIIKVTAGDSHSAVLTDKEEVYVWGNFRDEHGSVGLTPQCEGKLTCKPIQLLPDIKFKDIASGSNHMLLLDAQGVVYSFGVGAQGQLGRLKSDKDGETLDITAENRELFLTPQKVSMDEVDPNRPFVCDAIYAGNFSSFATNTDKKKNRLAGWGLNNYFQLGYKGQTKGQLIQHIPKRSTFTCATSIINVACGQHHTLFLTKSGRVHSAGRHEYGMLGLGKQSKEVCPAKRIDILQDKIIDISAGINTSFAVSDDGKLYAWGMGGPNLGLQGEDDLTVPTEVKSLEGRKIVSVSAGGAFTCVVVDNN